MKNKSSAVLNKSFRDTPIKWHGLTFHRFSLETQLLVMDAELTFLYDPSVKLGIKEQIAQMTEFLYIHGTPPDDVPFKSDAPEAYRAAVRQFARAIPMTGLKGLEEVIGQIIAGVPEATVDIHEKPSVGSSRETPPPN